MKQSKEQNYSNLKLVLRVLTLGIAIWALIIAYKAKDTADWIDSKQDLIIEKLLFKGFEDR